LLWIAIEFIADRAYSVPGRGLNGPQNLGFCWFGAFGGWFFGILGLKVLVAGMEYARGAIEFVVLEG
jgi:hypothetical protein